MSGSVRENRVPLMDSGCGIVAEPSSKTPCGVLGSRVEIRERTNRTLWILNYKQILYVWMISHLPYLSRPCVKQTCCGTSPHLDRSRWRPLNVTSVYMTNQPFYLSKRKRVILILRTNIKSNAHNIDSLSVRIWVWVSLKGQIQDNTPVLPYLIFHPMKKLKPVCTQHKFPCFPVLFQIGSYRKIWTLRAAVNCVLAFKFSLGHLVPQQYFNLSVVIRNAAPFCAKTPV